MSDTRLLRNVLFTGPLRKVGNVLIEALGTQGLADVTRQLLWKLPPLAKLSLLEEQFEALSRAGPGVFEKDLTSLREELQRRRFSALMQVVWQHASMRIKHEFYETVLEWATADQQTVIYATNVASNMRGDVEGCLGELEGARILEIGPGWSLANGLLAVAGGAESYVAADPHPVTTFDSWFYRGLRAMTVEQGDPAVAARFDAVVDVSAARARFDEERVRLLPVDAAELPLEDASLDVVVSNSVLEHVHRPAEVARETARVLSPGGWAVHQIDLRDHRDFDAPWEFLCYDRADWEQLLAEYSFEYTNRLRLGDWDALFREAGLDVEARRIDKQAPVTPELRARLHADYARRSDEDLSALSVKFILRKPSSS
jgi:2-polyprenyl-3-methyl-5-hydroxy-6-metoxy-1,4-benzoquinol methylase